MNRIILAIIFCAAAFAQQAAGPSFGKWTYAGKDNAGVDWKGTFMRTKQPASVVKSGEWTARFGAK